MKTKVIKKAPPAVEPGAISLRKLALRKLLLFFIFYNIYYIFSNFFQNFFYLQHTHTTGERLPEFQNHNRRSYK